MAIMIHYRNRKVELRSPDGDTNFFNFVTGVFQEDILAPYLFINFMDYALQTSIDRIKKWLDAKNG